MSTQPENHEAALQRLYDSEINFAISTFWDGGFDWKLGDDTNGFSDEGWSNTFAECVDEIVEAALLRYPASAFAREMASIRGESKGTRVETKRGESK